MFRNSKKPHNHAVFKHAIAYRAENVSNDFLSLCLISIITDPGNAVTRLLIADQRPDRFREPFFLQGFNYEYRILCQQAAALMKRLDNCGRFGYPVFVVLNEKGEPIHIQESESLEEGKGYSRKKVEKFLRLWNKKAVEAEVK